MFSLALIGIPIAYLVVLVGLLVRREPGGLGLSLLFFAAAVIIALTMGAPASIVNWLAGLYILIRIVHGLLYIADQASLRSMSYLAGFVVNVAIFVLPAFK